MQHLKKAHLLISIFSGVITSTLVAWWIAFAGPGAGPGGLAILIALPFIFSFIFFIINSFFYLLLLVKNVSSKRQEYAVLHLENTFWYVITLLLAWGCIILNSNVIAAFAFLLLSLILYSLPFFAVHTLFYPGVTERLVSVNTKKYALPIIGFFLITTLVFQLFLTGFLRYDYAKIDALARTYNTSLLGRKVTENCMVESIYDVQNLPIQTFITTNNEVKIDRAPQAYVTWEQISYDIDRVPTKSAYITTPTTTIVMEKLQEFIKDSDAENVLISTRLEGPDIITGSIKNADTVKVIYVYNVTSDTYSNYLVIRSYSEPICNYLQADFFGIFRRDYNL